MDRPRFFQDRMVRGAFKSFEHDHLFEAVGDGQTRMIDVLRFAAPGGWLAWPIERWVLLPYLRRLIDQRGEALKAMAEDARHGG